jgi:hypothetical protein
MLVALLVFTCAACALDGRIHVGVDGRPYYRGYSHDVVRGSDGWVVTHGVTYGYGPVHMKHGELFPVAGGMDGGIHDRH